MRTTILSLSAALGLFCAPLAASADSWIRPTVTEVFSESRDYFVRVTPGNDIGSVVGFAGEPRGSNATAEFYRRQADRSYALTATVTLVNPIAPVNYLVSNDGRLITLDNWHNMGYGPVVALYGADGALVRAYTLAELFSEAEIEAFPHSVSSIHWRHGIPYLREERDLYVQVAPEDSGRGLIVGLQTGAFKYCEGVDDTYRCRNSNADRIWRGNADLPDPR